MKDLEYYKKLLKLTFVDYNQTSEIEKNPVILTKAEGLYQWDIHGKRYFDAIGGVFVACLGNRPPKVVEAVKKQLDKITLGAPLHAATDVGLEFVEKLGSVSPGNLNFIKGYSCLL